MQLAMLQHKMVLLVHIYVELVIESSHGTGGGDWKIPESF